MGVDYNAYIGPYVRATVEVQKKTIDRCEKHNFLAGMEFCPKCGTSKLTREQTYDADLTPPGWVECFPKGEIYNYLYSTSCMSSPDIFQKDGKSYRTYIYLPNRYRKELNIPELSGGRYSESEIPFEELDVPNILVKFNELYKEEIAYMKQWFQIEIKFGYIAYCS